MCSRFLAVVLISLIVSPFTAPFSVCDFTTVVVRYARQAVPPVRSTRRLETDTSVTTPVPPLIRGAGRIRTLASVGMNPVTPASNPGTRVGDTRANRPLSSSSPRLIALRV